MESSSRLGLLRRSPAFRSLFLATAGSSFGTYLAAIALIVTIYDKTQSGVWVAALLIVDFLPIVLVGLLLGPLLDRLSRRNLMIFSDLVRCAVFAALPFVDRPAGIVGLAAVSGIATGLFTPAVYAGLPNLVPEEELTNANSLLQTVETLAWMIGPILGGVLVTVWGRTVPFAVNSVTFLLSAVLVSRIDERRLRSAESLTRGYWRDVTDGLRLVVTARPLRTVLIVWNIAILGSAAINVAEVEFAKKTLGAGNLGYAAFVAGSGMGLALGSFLSAPALAQVGLRRHYVGSIALMGVGWGAAGLERLDLARRALRDRRSGRERRCSGLQPPLRAAWRARPLPRPRARDPHELDVRRHGARDGGRGRPHGRRRGAGGVGRGRRSVPRRVVRRAPHDTLAPHRNRARSRRRSRRAPSSQWPRSRTAASWARPSRSRRTASDMAVSSGSRRFSRRSRPGASGSRAGRLDPERQRGRDIESVRAPEGLDGRGARRGRARGGPAGSRACDLARRGR